MNLKSHLRQYGIKHFDDDSYWEWGGQIIFKAVGEEGMTRLEDLQAPLQTGDETIEQRQAFYDFISNPDLAGVAHSMKAEAIKTCGEKVMQFTENRKDILDFGCNIGYLTTWYAIKNPKSKITGIDINQKSIRTAQQFAKKLKVKNAEFLGGELGNLTVGKFDLIVDTQSIFEAANPTGILHWIFDHLNDDGILVSIPQTPNLEQFLSHYDKIQNAGLFIKQLEPLQFSDVGKRGGYGVFVAGKKKTIKNFNKPDEVYGQILKYVRGC